MRAFGYERPSTLRDAVALLAGDPGRARLLAGGTDLIIGLRDGSIRPDVVVDVKGVRELDDGIREEGGRLVIGARAVMTDIAAHPRIRCDFTSLAEAASAVGSIQIRNRATLAGNVCNASPAADTVPSLLVHDATVVVEGAAGRRRIPIEEVLVRSGVTTIGPDEIVTAIELPLPTERRASTHARRTRRRGHDLASVTLACTVGRDGLIRLAYGSVGPRPLLVADQAGVLADPAASTGDRIAVLDRLFADASPSLRSMRAGPAYRLAMLRVLGLRAVDAAAARLAAGVA